MKKRNLKLIVLTFTVATFLSSNIIVFAKSSQPEKSKVTSSQNGENDNKKTDGQRVNNDNKKTKKEILTLSNRLDDIEVSLKSILRSMDTYINGKTTKDEQGDNTTTSSAIEITNPDSTTTPSGIDVTNTTTSSAIDTDDLSDDFESEYKKEDTGVYNSFYGKLNAINNRLNTIERQISRINSSDNSDLTQLNDRLTKLREQVKASIDNLAKVQKQNVEKVKEKSDRKKMEDQKINQDKKIWRIRFTKELKEETINSRNIMIVDSNNNVLDGNISYDKKDKSIMIQIGDGFNKGETYTILIGNEVQSIEGKNLPRPVEKKFTVN